MDKLRPVEIALIFGIVSALVLGSGTAAAQEQLADSLIRLHIIAHSDSSADQADKLAVRDAVLELVRDCTEQAVNVSETEMLLRDKLPELERAGEEVLKRRGNDHPVTASIVDCYFPTKDYQGFALPAGCYTALRIEIGEGKGANWWCVAFPPLCLGSCSESMEEAVQAGIFTTEQVKFLTGEGGNYILKFRCMELLGQLKGAFWRE